MHRPICLCEEWSYAGFTLNRFQYPDDPALHLPKGVRGEPMARRVNGRLLLFTLDMYSHYLSVYRFDSTAQGEESPMQSPPVALRPARAEPRQRLGSAAPVPARVRGSLRRLVTPGAFYPDVRLD